LTVIPGKTVLAAFWAAVTPKLPTTQQNIILEGQWIPTTTGEEFLLFDDGDNNRIITFDTSQNLTDLANNFSLVTLVVV
jgi:hypothetical protein